MRRSTPAVYTCHFSRQMRNVKLPRTLSLAVILITTAVAAQDALRGTLTVGFGDIAEIKQKAEAGDAAAQVALGEALASRFHASEALGWYRKAAAQGNVEGEYHVGDMLLFGALGIPSNLGVHS